MTRFELLELAKTLDYDIKSMPLSEFLMWLHANEEIYNYFRKYAREAIASGRQRFSAYMIRERVRWYVNVEYAGAFKISNNLTPWIARLLAEEMPELKKIFRFKETMAFIGE